MAWEIENTVAATGNQNKPTAPQWEVEQTQPMTQSVMDSSDNQIYNVPVGMDARDAKFAIDTQHGGKDKGSFLGKVWTGIDIVGSSIEEVFQDFDRAAVEHAGQLVDSLVLDKGLRYQKRMKLVEDWENGDWSYFGDKEFSDEEKQDIIRRQKEKIAYIQNLRERTQKFFNKGAQIMRPVEKLDNADKFFIAASSGIVSSAEAVGVAMVTKNPTVAAAAIGGAYAALKDTEYFDKAIAAGESANEASDQAAVAGAIEGSLEFVGDRLLLGIAKFKPIQQLGNKVINSSIAKLMQNKVGRVAVAKIASRHPQSLWGAAAKGAVSEGGEEFLQEGAGMLWENYNDVSSYGMDEVLSQSLFAFAAGAIPGAGMGTVGTSIYNQKVSKDNTAIKNLLKENTPELTETELQVVADNVQEVLMQEGAAYDEEFTKLLRKETEIDVMPDGLTAESLNADTRNLLKEKYGMSDEDINKTIDIATNYIDSRNGFNETYNEYFDKMDTAGYDRGVADNAARVLAARAVTIARQEGVSTEEVRKRWNLNLTRQSYEDFKNHVPVTDNYTARQRQIDDIMSVVPDGWTVEQKKALRKGLAARARYGDLEAANFNAETAKAWFENKGADESVKAINKRVQAIMGVLNAKEELETIKKSKRINPQQINPFEALIDDKLYKKIAKIEKENKGDSLITFIVKRGGLKDVGGELKAKDAQKQRIGLINNKSGNSFDDMALSAWENGYFPAKTERPTINDLLDAIDDELFGKKRYQFQEGNTQSMTEYVDSLAEQMDMLGIDYSNMTAEEAEAAYNKAAEEYAKNAKQAEPEYVDNGVNFDDDFTLFQFAGANARTADMTSLEQAKNMDNSGADAETIRKQTGWFKGADSKWRFEISDKDATVDLSVWRQTSRETARAIDKQIDYYNAEMRRLIKKRDGGDMAQADFEKAYNEALRLRMEAVDKLNNGKLTPVVKLSDVLQHDALYAAYPELANLKLSFVFFDNFHKMGSYRDDILYLNEELQGNLKELKSVLMHEIQHAIQRKEDFAVGGSPDMAQRLMDTLGLTADIKIEEEKRKYFMGILNNAEKVQDILNKQYFYNKSFKELMENPDSEKLKKEAEDWNNQYFDTLKKYGISKEQLALSNNTTTKKLVSFLKKATPHEVYERLLGEVEARNTQARMDMSNEERAATTPESTQDVKNADAIVVFEDGTEAAYISENVRVENGIVDLSTAFEKTPTQKEVMAFINNAIDTATKFKTLSPDFFLDMPTRKKAIRKFSNDANYKKLNKEERERYRKYIIALDKIAENTSQLPPPEGVKNTKIGKKPMVERYYYFGARVRFGNKVFDLVFDTEKNKTDSATKPQTVHLYSLNEKGNLTGQGANTLASKGSLVAFNNNVSQIKENVNRNLVVYHTINKDNLQKAIDFGGFPAPSLAIVNKNEPFNFGNGKDNIQLIGNKDLINPKNGTDVYNRDVWTKTFPFATYETPTFEAARKFENDYKQYFDRVNDRGALSSLTYVAQSNPTAARDSFVNSTGAKLAYLEQTKGKKIELPKRDLSADYLKQGDIDVQFVEEVKDFDENSDREEFLQKMSEAAKRLLDRKYDNSTSRFAQKLKQKMLEMDFDANGVIYFGVADRYLNNAKRYLQTKGVEAVDYYAARDFIDEQITNENAYRQWATKQIEDKLLGEPKVEVAGEFLPFTLENVTKAMVDGATQNAQDSLVYGSGKAIAAGAKP